ncbi:phage major capsid protein [Bradyrhizobium sp. HKCCYLRH3099]|uniref:phage major capsid protein n=1 Tax=unclassified Bradyrhizobium TaxID=2631580 RepID=UPI003EC0853C
MDELQQLREQLGRAVDELGSPAVIADAAAYEKMERSISDLQGQIERLERARARSAALARPVGGQDPQRAAAPIIVPESLSLDSIAPVETRRAWQGDDYTRAVRRAIDFTPDPERHFRSFGEQLLAVASASLSARSGVARQDPRLQRAEVSFDRAPTGMGELDPSAGGFMVQTDFSTAIFARAYDMGQLLSRVRKLSISSASNGIKIPGIDETSRATGSRWGGVQSYWLGEGGTAAASKPKFRLIELDLKKLMANWYVSDEMLADASVVNSIASEAFSEEITFMTENAIVRGSGSGQPQGYLNSAAKITIAKEIGQASTTILYENILKMWSRMWGRSRQNAVWFINQDVEPQLYALSQVIGTAGVPVYLPPNGISGQPYGVLFGRPVIPVEYASTLGTEGDISLVDLSQYVLADKGGVQAASSMHVAFLTDEMVFRITYRVDGESIWHSPLTPFQGTNTLSPFVTLANR